ncbi:MAG: aldo/keto reductase [Magnetococcales bacterium]|nr:aldo/keto reductase [Magnetococcales bacterium]MBF0113447.1 aldo/keto reductase [Magnetococcales bacterium]
MKRRDFLQSSVVLAAGSVLPTVAVAAGGGSEAGKTGKPTIKSYRALGKTHIQMSDISFGAGKLPSAAMILRAIDQGVNYFDTAPDYGNSETLIGEAMGRFKQREKIYIASKYCSANPYPGHLGLGSKKADYLAAVDGSLKRMHLDYLDVVFVHAIGEKSASLEEEERRLLDEEMLAATAELKKAGKVRYLAVSSHGPNNLEPLLGKAVESGHYDVIMTAFNFMKFPKLPEVLQKAADRGVGVIAMKTLAGAKEGNVDAGGAVFEHAAFRWVLKHPQVAGLVVTIKTVDDLNLYVQASGTAFTAADQRSLDRYAALYGQSYCRTGCGDCMGSCAQGVDIANILRYQMYFADYGDEKRAMQSYAALSRPAAACLTCSTPTCRSACSHGLPVSSMLQAAHRSLTFSTVA